MEIKAINQLVSCQAAINQMSWDTDNRESISHLLKDLDFVLYSKACFALSSETAGDPFCIKCMHQKNTGHQSNPSEINCQLLDKDGFRAFPVKTKFTFFGWIILHLLENLPDSLITILNNLTDSIALNIENVQQKKRLETYQQNTILLQKNDGDWIPGNSFPDSYARENGPSDAMVTENDSVEFKRLLEEIKNQRSFYEQKFLQSATSTQILDREGWCIRINQKLSDLFGVKPEHIEGHQYNIFEDGEIIRQGIDLILRRVIQEKKTEHWEVNFDIGAASESQHIVIDEHKKVWFANTAFPILDHNGEVTHLIVQHEDISVRKWAEEALTESEEKFAAAFRNSPISILLTEPFTGAILDVNDTFLRDMEYTREETIGKTSAELNIFADNKDRLLLLDELRKNNSVFGKEYRFKSKSGRILTGLMSIVFLRIKEKTVQLSIAIDITDRKHAENALKESEELFRRAFQTSPDSININRLADGMYIKINQGFTSIMGFTEEEIIGKTSLEKNIWVNPDERIKLVQGLKRDGFVTNHEALFKKKDGSIVSGLMSASYIDLNGVPHILSITRNISDIKKIQNELQVNEERFRRVFQEGRFSMALCGKDFRFLKVNDAFCKMTGYPENELLALTFTDITHPAHVEADVESIKKLYDGFIQVYQSEKRYIRKDKRVVWGSINISAMRDPHGAFLYFLAMINDVTERKMVEVALKENNYRLDLAMQTANMAWWEMDIPTGNVRFHPRKTEMIGYPSENFRHYNDFMVLVHPDDYIKTMESMRNHLGGKMEKYESEYRILTKSGDYRWFYDIGTIVKKDATGSPASLTGLVEDITDRKNIEEEIRMLNSNLEQKVAERTEQLLLANKELEAFSYSVSHDLRAPLRAIIGFTNILVEDHEGSLNDEGRRVCGIISSSAEKLGKLIDDLLAFSRLSRGEIQISKMNMGKLIQTIFQELTTEKERNRIDFRVDALPQAIGDITMIKQVWINLLSNAIKYSARKERASIEIGAQKNENETIYYIRDNGIGFDMQFAGKLFGVFQRLHSTREYDGNGVGLAIVQRIVQKHGGRVWANGSIDEGAVFYITLPNFKE